VLKKKNLEDEGRSTGEACDHGLGIQVRSEQGFSIRQHPAFEMTLAGSKASGQIAKAFSPVMPAERPYPGTCRALMRIEGDGAWRLIVPDSPIEFSDRLFGYQKSRLVESIGDFVVVRSNGQSSYHLAVVVDDEKDGVTDVVRGDDLLSSTARHIALQQLLAYREIRYCHLPVLRDAQGQKLSKQQGAKALVPQHALENLRQAAQHLGLGALSADSLEGFLSQATVAWAARWIGSKSSSDRVTEAGN
jgi:glutamyl-Q tRNA(Asp) synthetase